MKQIYHHFQSHGICVSDRALDSWKMTLNFVHVAKQRVQDITSDERLLLASEVCEFFNCLELGVGRTDETGSTLFSILLHQYLWPIIYASSDPSFEDLCLLDILLESKAMRLAGSIHASGSNPLQICVQWIAQAVSMSRLSHGTDLKKNIFESALPYIIVRLITLGCNLHALENGYTPASRAQAHGSEALEWWSALMELAVGMNAEQILLLESEGGCSGNWKPKERPVVAMG